MANLVATAIGRLRRGPRSAVIGGAALGLVAMIAVGLAFGPLRSPGGPVVSIGKDSAGAALKPHLSADEVVAALRPSLSGDDRVVSMSVARLIDFKAIAGDQPSGNGDDLLWYVRVAGPAPAFPPMAWGASDSGWMVLDDASGRLRGAGGWGFVSATDDSYPPSPKPSLPAGLFALPTTNWLESPDSICAGVGLSAVLHGSPNDPHIAWLESNVRGDVRRTEVLWPAGYRARFSPNLEILNESGIVVLSEGDAISGACVTGLPSPWGVTSPSK